MVMACAIQKRFGGAVEIAAVGADSMIMTASALHDERDDAGADAKQSARRSRRCRQTLGDAKCQT